MSEPSIGSSAKRWAGDPSKKRPAHINIEPHPGQKAKNIGPIVWRLFCHTVFPNVADFLLAGETGVCTQDEGNVTIGAQLVLRSGPFHIRLPYVLDGMVCSYCRLLNAMSIVLFALSADSMVLKEVNLFCASRSAVIFFFSLSNPSADGSFLSLKLMT